MSQLDPLRTRGEERRFCLSVHVCVCVRSCPLSMDAEASMASGGFPVLNGCC